MTARAKAALSGFQGGGNPPPYPTTVPGLAPALASTQLVRPGSFTSSDG